MPTFKAGNLSSSKADGYTLFELLIVIALIGIMLGVVIPNVNMGSTSGDMRTAVRRISGAVAEARSRALLKRQPLQMVIEEERLLLYQILNGQNEQIAVVKMPDGVTIEQVAVSGGQHRSVLQFLPKGVTQPAALWLSADDEWQTVFIKPVTGVETEDGRQDLAVNNDI